MTPPEVGITNQDISRAVRIVRNGGLVVFPTDTVYGLGCDPFNEEAVRLLFEAKGRSAKPIPVLCSSIDKARELVELSGVAEELAEKYWPGALTIVAPLRKPVPRLLDQGTSSLGVRVPAHAACIELIAGCGGWLTGTSANLSGRPSSRSAQEAVAQLGDSVGLVLDGGRLSGKESTIVSAMGEKLTILRGGAVGVGNEMKARRTS